MKKKFRVWDKSRGRFTRYVNNTIGDDVYFSISLDGEIEAIDRSGHEVNIDQENFVIEQFTNVEDTNGKEIYEGDILKSGYLLNSVSPCEVEFEHFIYWKSESNVDEDYNKEHLEVIGNIHENLELLNLTSAQ
jgi:hypothetical protein